MRDVKMNGNKTLYALIAFVVLAIASLWISALVLKVSVVLVCILVVLQAALAACLHNSELWLHVALGIAEVIFGVLSGNVIVVIMMLVLYIVATYALECGDAA